MLLVCRRCSSSCCRCSGMSPVESRSQGRFETVLSTGSARATRKMGASASSRCRHEVDVRLSVSGPALVSVVDDLGPRAASAAGRQFGVGAGEDSQKLDSMHHCSDLPVGASPRRPSEVADVARGLHLPARASHAAQVHRVTRGSTSEPPVHGELVQKQGHFSHDCHRGDVARSREGVQGFMNPPDKLARMEEALRTVTKFLQEGASTTTRLLRSPSESTCLGGS
jgi:hypothetical protein